MDNKKNFTPNALNDDALETVAGGANSGVYFCSQCHADITASVENTGNYLKGLCSDCYVKKLFGGK